MSAKILLCEDDLNLSFIVQDNLEQNGFVVAAFDNGAKAFQAFQQENIDLCILDVSVQEMDGFTLASKIREINPQVPILFLTARMLKEDKLKAFQLGADDYITKPFSIEELIMRCRVFLRRSSTNKSEAEKIQIGQYQFELSSLLLSSSSSEKKLTRKEAELLKLLRAKSNEMITREEILLKIWGSDDYFLGRSMDVFISRLRKYLQEDKNIELINYHGLGFMLKIKV
jgi:DNA-binding response OmpR family regulator